MKPVISTLIAAIFLPTLAVADETVCMPADEMKAALIDWYGERPTADTAGAPLQVWVSEETGTWSMVSVAKNGRACVEATGENWNTNTTGQDIVAELEIG